MKIFLQTIILVLVLLPATLRADERNSGFQFLNAPYSPRLAAMGGGYSSDFGDISAMFGNPAGLAWMGRGEITCSYGDYLLDLKGGWLGGIYPLAGQISLGAGIIYFDYGSFTEADRFGDLSGNTFGARDLALNGSIAGTFLSSFAWGLTLKYIYSKIDVYSAGAVAADLGILYRISSLQNITLGLAVRNIGQSLDAYYQDKESLPTTLGFALSKQINPYPVTVLAGWNNLMLNGSRETDALRNFSVGLEIASIEQLILRIGFNNQRRSDLEGFGSSGFSGLSAGFGLQTGALQFDYAYSNYGDPGATHHFGLTCRLGGGKGDFFIKRGSKTSHSDLSVPPQGVRYTIARDTLIISWEPVASAFYNVYVRLDQSANWVLVNKAPRRRNYINLKKPRTKGIYVFAITLVADGKESYFSREIRVEIP